MRLLYLAEPLLWAAVSSLFAGLPYCVCVRLRLSPSGSIGDSPVPFGFAEGGYADEGTAFVQYQATATIKSPNNGDDKKKRGARHGKPEGKEDENGNDGGDPPRPPKDSKEHHSEEGSKGPQQKKDKPSSFLEFGKLKLFKKSSKGKKSNTQGKGGKGGQGPSDGNDPPTTSPKARKVLGYD